MVYVGVLFRTLSSADWPYSQACHMYADTEPELMAFAERLRLKPRHVQKRRRPVHFDLTQSKRREAVDLGAAEWSRAEEVAHIRAVRGDHKRGEEARRR